MSDRAERRLLIAERTREHVSSLADNDNPEVEDDAIAGYAWYEEKPIFSFVGNGKGALVIFFPFRTDIKIQAGNTFKSETETASQEALEMAANLFKGIENEVFDTKIK